MTWDTLQDAPPSGLLAVAILAVSLSHALALQGWPYAMCSIDQVVMGAWQQASSATPSAEQP